MDITTKIKTRTINHMKDPLYKISFFIMLTYITNAGFGFFFWMFAAKLYPKRMSVLQSHVFI